MKILLPSENKSYKYGKGIAKRHRLKNKNVALSVRLMNPK
tara:strand:+ start:371 stop:490 length:120 start_codon:yes stop_codon:yes gene_type:complete